MMPMIDHSNYSKNLHRIKPEFEAFAQKKVLRRKMIVVLSLYFQVKENELSIFCNEEVSLIHEGSEKSMFWLLCSLFL